MIITLTLGLAAGCAPGDISRYAAKAQRAGEAIFEGRAVPAAAEAEDAADRTETTASGAESTFDPEQESAGVAESFAEPESASIEESSAEMPGTDESEAFAETQSTAGSEAAGETQSTAGSETSTEVQSTAGIETAVGMQDTSVSRDPDSTRQEQSQPAELPAMMKTVEERTLAAVAQKAEWIKGTLAGKDTLTKAQQDALQAVLEQEAYSDKTLCLINSASFEGQETGSFLLFCDSTALTARGKMSGDLWYYAGEKAVRVLKNAEFMQLHPIQCGGRNYMLVQTLEDGKTSAQVYRVKGGRAAGCFTNAVSVEQEGDVLRVNYKSEHNQYDPTSESWSGGEAEITYFYVPDEDGFVQESVRELTTEQYLAYIQPEENDADARHFREEQEEKFYHTCEDAQEYRYSFFAIGDSRIGYRECRIGLPGENADGNDHVAAEYTYHIAKLENGKLTQQCETLSGSGYYFAQWSQKKEELQKLFEIPPLYLKNRIDRTGRTLQPKERTALQCVQAVQEYDADGLCFVEQEDYDGDGEAESFVAIGRYDGILGAAVCDLWFVSGNEPVLLEEKLPVTNVFSFETEGTFLFLLEGFETDGARDRLYGVKEAAAQRYLKNASGIGVEENGDLTARIIGSEGELPYFFHIPNGEVTEYGVQEKAPEILLDYENGKAVYRHMQKLADMQEGELSCLVRENGLIHVMVTDQKGNVSYETYRVQSDALVLIDCGDGGYTASALKPGGVETEDAETESEEIQETEMTETETDTAE